MQEVTITRDDAVRFLQDIHDKIRCRSREVIETVLEEELTAALGSDSYERNDDRRGYRNGAQVRTMMAAGGSREVRIPPVEARGQERSLCRGRLAYARASEDAEEVVLPVLVDYQPSELR